MYNDWFVFIHFKLIDIMANKDWKLIAASLGLIIPMSLMAGETPAKVNIHEGEQVSSILSNQVRDRIMGFQQTAPQESDQMFPDHTNSHTDVGGKHTNFHSNRPHTNSHVDQSNPNTCPPTHTNYHTNYQDDSHTDYSTSHTNYHTNETC